MPLIDQLLKGSGKVSRVNTSSWILSLLGYWQQRIQEERIFIYAYTSINYQQFYV